ncbi:MAG TPA: DGQHR domain-containing protein [Sphingomicrobium sp.]|jgi:DGQHR domain-containing protein
MATINVPAARVQQGTLSLFATAIRVKDLLEPGFYSVDTLDPESGDKGYQRLLNTARAKRLADYVIAGQDTKDAFLPTSVFLATDKQLYINESNNTLTIDTDAVGPFSVVDGQHRLEGLRLAAGKDARVLDFEVPVNIATNLNQLAQMCHFLIVNTTQKSVDKAVEQQIVARLSDAIEFEDVPSLPRWIRRIVERGEVDRALKMIEYLNTTADSPWHSKVQMANAQGGGFAIKQDTFAKAIIKYVLTANNPITALKDFDREKKVYLNYWKAVASLLDDGDSDTLYKYNGVELFSRFSVPFFMRMMDKGSFKVEDMKGALERCFENMDGEFAGVGHPEFWKTGGKAGMLNAAAIAAMVQEMAGALHKSGMSAEIEI